MGKHGSQEKLFHYLAGSAEAQALAANIDFDRLPAHVAIIMDGNGRWAGRYGFSRIHGHRAGIVSVRETVETSARMGLDHLTLYAFSRENWKRPESEVSALMDLLIEFLRRERANLIVNNIRFDTFGRLDEMSVGVQREVNETIDLTRGNDGLNFHIALNYSGRSEIVDAINRWQQAQSRLPRTINEKEIGYFLDSAASPDPDLLIRTSGELRISNFLLWQIAYSEIWVTDVFWPKFRRLHLLEAIVDYQKRERRYGGLV